MKLTQEEVVQRVTSTFKQPVEVITNYINKRSPIGIRCLECGHEWYPIAQSVMYMSGIKEGHECPSCRIKKIEVECGYCGKKIVKRPSEFKTSKSGFHYCSKTCGNLHKNQMRRDNGEWKDSQNYRLKAFENLKHQCAVCGWDEDERLLEVHHIDSNHSNNELDNLCILCVLCHRKISLGYYSLDTTEWKLREI